MKINTNNNITTPLPRRSDVAYENRGSEWHNRWLSWLVLCISLSLGLGFASDIQAGSRKNYCGGSGQRPCKVWEAFPSCDSGLAEDFIKGTCGKDVVGKWVETAVQDTGKTIITTGETVVKFTEEQGKKAIDETKKGVAAAGKAIEGVAVAVYRQAAKDFVGPIIEPLKNMAQAWKDSKSRDPIAFDALVKAIQRGNGPQTEVALKKVLHGMFVGANSPFELIVKDFKDKNAGSLLFVVGAGAGAGITFEGGLGIAIDIDYLIHFGQKIKQGSSVGGFEGPILSLFTAIGFQAGPAVGGSIDFMIGYHVANPDGVNGPSFDVGLEVTFVVGVGLGVGFDMTAVPWKANTAGIGVATGKKIALSAGASYAWILGQLCGDGTFKALASACSTVTAGTTSQSSTAFGGAAGRATDGNTDGNYGNNSVTHTNIEANPWWQHDLGTEGTIASIQIHNRTDCCSERLLNAKVFVSKTPFPSNFNPTTASAEATLKNTVSQTVQVNKPGRYVRIQHTGTGILSLAEVKVQTGTAPEMEIGKDRPGSDILNFVPPLADPSACQIACGLLPQCKAWTYVKPGSGGPRCYLKDPAPNPVSNACCTSGLKSSSTTSGSGTGTASTLPDACTPTAVTPMYGGYYSIKKFELKDAQNNVVISNTQNNNAVIYEDFTSQTIQADPGAVFSYAVTSEGNGPTDIWIDLNNDGTFDKNAGERVVHNTVASNKKGQLTIPTTLTTGVYRMRVRVVPNYTSDSCQANKWSQVEDYTLQISGSL